MWSIVFLTLLVIANAGAFVFFTRRFKHMQKKQSDELAALRKEFRILTGSMTEVGCHLVEIERQLGDMDDKQSEIADKTHHAEGTDMADYEQAKRLLEMGAEVEELVATCGLTRAEAELLERVQR